MQDKHGGPPTRSGEENVHGVRHRPGRARRAWDRARQPAGSAVRREKAETCRMWCEIFCKTDGRRFKEEAELTQHTDELFAKNKSKKERTGLKERLWWQPAHGWCEDNDVFFSFLRE